MWGLQGRYSHSCMPPPPIPHGLVHWSLTPEEQPGSYQGGEMMNSRRDESGSSPSYRGPFWTSCYIYICAEHTVCFRGWGDIPYVQYKYIGFCLSILGSISTIHKHGSMIRGSNFQLEKKKIGKSPSNGHFCHILYQGQVTYMDIIIT